LHWKFDMKLVPRMRAAAIAIIICWQSLFCQSADTAEFEINGYQFALPDGFTIRRVADESLVERPVSASFDDAGNLYVTEASGTNDPSAKQLEDKPHCLLRLADTDGDGVFDTRTIFAEGLMFPEGCLWHDGAVYVAAPPSIWKFVDTDGDGVADQRSEWFQGKTLTGCANDLHGPYLGRDGWIYWCKGAFAEQTYDRLNLPPLITRASHIFRQRPEGGTIEWVMTGGMDNPVEVAFSQTGERFFTTTFLQHPSDGKRDGIIHAIYGGVYGKDHGVIDGHPRTGELMPPLVHLGAAAPSGLMIADSAELGEAYQGNLFASLFNMHKITRHRLIPQGSSFVADVEDFLTCNSFDFHPTDVLEDADGSLVVVDTGGWYKLCCPTSQLYKPEIHGGLYRVSRIDAHLVADPRGMQIDWQHQSPTQLFGLLADDRPAVQQRAIQELAKRGNEAVTPLKKSLEQSNSDQQTAINAAWTLCKISTVESIDLLSQLLDHDDTAVRHAALHALSVNLRLLEQNANIGKANIGNALCSQLVHASPAVRRAAGEVIGRWGHTHADDAHVLVTSILAAASNQNDRALEHSLIYALIEIGETETLESALHSDNPAHIRIALIALDQMPTSKLRPNQVSGLLNSADDDLRRAAIWVIMGHADWATELAPEIEKLCLRDDLTASTLSDLQQLFVRWFANPSAREFASKLLGTKLASSEIRTVLLTAMLECRLETRPVEWIAALENVLETSAEEELRLDCTLIAKYQLASDAATLRQALLAISQEKQLTAETRLLALSAIPPSSLSQDQFALVVANVIASSNLTNRSAAADIVKQNQLNDEQLRQLAQCLPNVSPLEIEAVCEAFSKTSNTAIGELLIKELSRAPAAAAIPRESLQKLASHFGPAAAEKLTLLFQKFDQDKQQQWALLNERLARLPSGDAARGQAIFKSGEAACAACHTLGYLGGKVGPDLRGIGNIRQRRDLMESILYPSASFVRGYEPVLVTTFQGQTFNGYIVVDNQRELVLMTSERKEVRIAREEIEEQTAGSMSIMPEGLDKQLSDQQLADLLEFLQTAR
jgi:putative membrane-bound dehydrogenase-like protein